MTPPYLPSERIANMNTIKMSNEEFDQCQLKTKLTFQESESARLVLVHEITSKEAAGIVGMRAKNDHLKVDDIVQQFIEAHKENTKKSKRRYQQDIGNLAAAI